MRTLTDHADALSCASARPRRLPIELALERASAWAWAPALAAWCALVAWVLPLHEPWFDEAQAWLIARDATLWEILGRMSYEGSPPLWHLLLAPLAKAGAP